MKTLVLDIETTPHTVHTWGLFDQNIAISQIVKPTEVLCFAAGWVGEKAIGFYRGENMASDAHALLDAADAVVTWNGDRFDLPHLNREFILAGLGEPSPYRSIDLLKTTRRKFKFASNKLDYISQALGVGEKTHHTGFQLWLDCMAGDEKAWRLMKKYNVQDVRVTREDYFKLLPWISGHPNVRLYGDGIPAEGCPNCGSARVERRGYAYTPVSKFQQFHCLNVKCGRWFRGTKRVDGDTVRGV